MERNVLDIRKDFPLIMNYNREGHLVYADNAATTQKPQCVIDALAEWYTSRNANPHRSTYKLATLATDIYEYSRSVVAEHIHAEKEEIIFCRNATEAINMVALGFVSRLLEPGDEIAVPISEHHSNLLPWQRLAKKYKCTLRPIFLDENGRIPDEELDTKITKKTKFVAVAHISNVLGNIFDVRSIAKKAHDVGAYILMDCAQSLLHFGTNVKELEVDFAVFSAHKAFGPDGLGVLWGRFDLLKETTPVYYGGEMVKDASWRTSTLERIPLCFESGTQYSSGAFAFSVALRYLEEIGQNAILEQEKRMTARLLEGMKQIPDLKIYGCTEAAEDRSSIIAFNFLGQSPILIGRFLDSGGINIRTGAHCARPLMEFLGVDAVCRISLAPYNTMQDVEHILKELETVPELINRLVKKRGR